MMRSVVEQPKRFRLDAVAPVDMRTARPFGHPSHLEPVYPPSHEGEALRNVRLWEANLTLRPAAARLGIKPSELSDLEMGRSVFAEPAMWSLARRILAGAPE
jgi:Helix-turn-helix